MLGFDSISEVSCEGQEAPGVNKQFTHCFLHVLHTHIHTGPYLYTLCALGVDLKQLATCCITGINQLAGQSVSELCPGYIFRGKMIFHAYLFS